ncbi:fatty acid desaturase [Actomonas aquatica]|uniref:Fatty acid desaturase n=1 Tax=Actomonas aquatica TaxID=2866162 RepID=A0ABZ1CAM3_9BACT|nr:fatty acid desaturase [Opitutus sp. WL0086]WRQ88690.1 fatty acid desaturase [Opitutus sp. WL0086]
MPFRIPGTQINWTNSSFLIGTGLATITAVPYYLWKVGIDWFQVALFLAFFIATGLSITLGYHRLFAHKAFKAAWPVRFLTLVFGAAAFENCALAWVSDHRRHHKHTDHDDDPYDISKGFWHAHIGWILFKINPEPPWDNVNDLRKDRLVMWQDKYYVTIAVTAGFLLPAALGWLYNGPVGALGAFLLAGVARVTAVQHMTFFINSLCHSVGNRPYSSRTSARDSWIMALFTFGEGYHNYHHEFQHDYRNGVKWWQFDPTKWTIWVLHKLGMASELRRVDDSKIISAQLSEAQRRVQEHLQTSADRINERTRELLHASAERLAEINARWNELKVHYREQVDALKKDYAHKTDEKWQEACHALEEMRREVRQAVALLDRLPAVA